MEPERMTIAELLIEYRDTGHDLIMGPLGYLRMRYEQGVVITDLDKNPNIRRTITDESNKLD